MKEKADINKWKANRVSLITGLLGAPVSWVALMSLSYIISSYTCYPHKHPLNMPIWPSFEMWIMIASAVCLVGAIIPGIIAYIAWRKTKDFGKGGKKDTVEIGEGRARFLAMLGILSSMLFIIAIIFSTCAILLVSECR